MKGCYYIIPLDNTFIRSKSRVVVMWMKEIHDDREIVSLDILIHNKSYNGHGPVKYHHNFRYCISKKKKERMGMREVVPSFFSFLFLLLFVLWKLPHSIYFFHLFQKVIFHSPNHREQEMIHMNWLINISWSFDYHLQYYSLWVMSYLVYWIWLNYD